MMEDNSIAAMQGPTKQQILKATVVAAVVACLVTGVWAQIAIVGVGAAAGWALLRRVENAKDSAPFRAVAVDRPSEQPRKRGGAEGAEDFGAAVGDFCG